MAHSDEYCCPYVQPILIAVYSLTRQAEEQIMAKLSRKDYEAIYKLFDEYALGDQRNYYKITVERFRKAASEVNRWRAIFSLLTGFASALAGLIVQAYLNAPAANGGTVCTVDPSACGPLRG